jgi:hypothetical protein
VRWRDRVQAGRVVIVASACFGLGVPAAPQPAALPATELAAGPDEAPADALGARLLGAAHIGTAPRPRHRSLRGAGRGQRWQPRLDRGPDVRLVAPPPLHAPPDSVLTLAFSRPMQPASVLRTFHVEPAVAGGLEWPDDRTAIFRPAAPLAYRTTYRVTVAGLPREGGSLVAEGHFAFSTVWPPPAVPYPFTLTFDDCGSAEGIQAILSALADRSLHAIFFPTGLCRDQFPWLVPALVAAGHRVCNHTYSHADLSKLPAPAIQSEIARGVAVGCNLMRPPYGAVDRAGRVAAAAASLGYRLQLWDVDTRDWAGTPADAMVAMIRARGGVVLMHMQGPHTVEAIRTL